MTLSDIATLIMALATTGSLLYISRQVNVTRQQTKGQFLLALDEKLEKFAPTTLQLMSEQPFVPTGSDWVEVWKLMSVFERINIMVEDKILDVALVNRLYGFMVTTLIANEAVYQRVLSSGVEWQDFIDLCCAIADHRQRTGLAETDATFIERVRKLNKQSRTTNPFRP